jgi:hypothetical protein
MRVLLSTFFFVVAIACCYLFATGAKNPPWEWSQADFLERVLAPFQVFSLFSGLLVLTAVIAFLLSLLCFECKGKNIANPSSRRSWGVALEIAFLLNVFLVAAVLGLLWLLVKPDSPGTPAAMETMGSLFAAVLLEVVLGTILAVVLFFLGKFRALYYSTLTAHIAELIVLGTIFLSGSATV